MIPKAFWIKPLEGPFTYDWTDKVETFLDIMFLASILCDLMMINGIFKWPFFHLSDVAETAHARRSVNILSKR